MVLSWTFAANTATLDPGLATSSPGEIRLAADGGTESVALPVTIGRRSSRFPGADRRQERRWVREAQSGSEEALERLYRRHWPWAHRAAYLVVHDAAAAEDIAQEAFLSAVRALDRFDRRRPFGPWLNRIVVNRAVDWARARSLRAETAIDPAFEVRSMADASSHAAPYSENVVRALASLPLEHRAVVVLRYLLEYTPGEIAEMLEVPRGTVNSRLRRALDRLGGVLAGVES
jgi:RNA polymerase sigma-70 factor, ECF subfamily